MVGLEVEAVIARYKERAGAVKKRNLRALGRR